MATFNYDITDGDQTFTGVDGNDVLNITGGISDRNLSFLQSGNDFLIETEAGTTITLQNHFLDNNARIETLNIAGAGSIDLSWASIKVNTGSTTLNGKTGDDLILGGLVNTNGKGNNINAGNGDDLIYGGAGTNTINAGNGDDTAYGGLGDDRFIEFGRGNDIYDGGDGTDSIEYKNSSTAIIANLATGTVDQDSDSTVDDTLSNIENITGSRVAAGDTITGDSGDNRIDGLAGDDTLYGGAGNDSLNGGEDDDIIYGGSGDDGIEDRFGINQLYGEDGDDSFTSANTAASTSQNTIDGGNGTDKVTYFGNPDGIVVDLVAGTVDKDGDSVTDDTLTSIESVLGSQSDDVITGDDEDNEFRGHGGDDVIRGGDGEDTIHGGNDDDTLYGEDGFDTLMGENGNDTLYGSAGSDELTGGAGDDTFVFEDINDYALNQSNTVTDFDSGDDVLDISDIIDDVTIPVFGDIFDNLRVVDDGTDTTIQIDQSGLGVAYNDVIELAGYTGHGHNAEDMVNAGYLII